MVKLALDDARGSEISTSSQKTSASSWTSKIAAARVDSTSRTGVAEGASFVMASKRSGSMCVRLVVARDDTVNIQACAAEARGKELGGAGDEEEDGGTLHCGGLGYAFNLFMFVVDVVDAVLYDAAGVTIHDRLLERLSGGVGGVAANHAVPSLVVSSNIIGVARAVHEPQLLVAGERWWRRRGAAAVRGGGSWRRGAAVRGGGWVAARERVLNFSSGRAARPQSRWSIHRLPRG